MSNPKKERKKCPNCSKQNARPESLYCSNVCQHAFQHKAYIEKWKRGEVKGLIKAGIVSRHVKNYLRVKYGNKCCLCGWSKVNLKTGIIPLVADHIDGNWENNAESNLRLICPNCDSLSPTYAALNKGRGRKERRESARAKVARSLE